MLQESLEKIVTELDVLIRARYPLIAVNTPEEGRFHRIMNAVAQLKCHREKEKGLFIWSRTTGLRQVLGAELKGQKEILIPDTQDAASVLEYIAQQKKGLFVLCDYSPYFAPYGQEDPQLVRRLRELAWEIKGRHINVLFVERNLPDVPALEKEIKVIELPMPDEREVTAMLDTQMQNLKAGEVRVEVDDRLREQFVQALLGLTESDIENVLAKAIISGNGLTAEALPVILDEKKSVIKGTGALTYTHAEPADHLGGYHNLRRILTEAAATFTPAARAYGVEPMKGLLMVGLPGCGKDLTKKIASSVLGKSLLDLDFGSVMGEGGGVIGSSAMTIKRALSIATTLKGILGISEFEKAVGGLESSARTDGGETARTIAYLLNWMQEQSDVFVIGTANDVRGLAAEQTRQGRFSHIVFVDLPTIEDRREIFAVHLRKRERNPDDFDLDELAETTEGFSGAEIEAAVKAGLLRAFMDGERKVTTADIVERARQIQPTSVIKREQVESLRNWAKDHMAVSAGGSGVTPINELARGARALEMYAKQEEASAMSKYMTFTEVVFKDRDLLIAALEEIGCKYIRQGENLEMGRYYSDQLQQRADIIIPRDTVGNCYGDIGFARSENGEYTPIIDDLDQRRVFNGQFIPKLRAAYNERVVSKVAARLRGTVHRAVEGGVVKIKVRY